MKKLKHLLFLSCLKATQLIEKKITLGLSRSEWLRLHIHKSMCDACTQFEKHSQFIEKGLSSLNRDKNHEIDLDRLKQSIIKKLDQ